MKVLIRSSGIREFPEAVFMNSSAGDVPFDAQRLHPDESAPSNRGKDKRTYFEHDRDRILYSSAFRRLAGVTQVAAVRERHLLHNRLTHSLKVAQLGRRIAQRLSDGLGPEYQSYLPDIAESAGLAHDIGHPPFGHIAEEVLERKMDGLGGFEGNAQSFRVVTKLAIAWMGTPGLNLTRASLNAILKYPRYRNDVRPSGHATGVPWTDRSYGSKWGAYLSEQTEFKHARKPSGENRVNEVRSPAAVIMDWADDVSYATHDLYDYFRAGLVPLHTLHKEESAATDEFVKFARDHLVKSREGFREERFREAYESLKGEMPTRKWGDSRSDRVTLGGFVNELIARFANAVDVSTESASGLSVAEDVQYQIEVLKQLTWFYVINRPALALSQEGQKAVIDRLFDGLVKLLERRNEKPDLENPVPVLLGEIYDDIVTHERERYGPVVSDEERSARAVCDYVCTLTEDQALDLYERITGLSVSRGSIFGAWFD